jgi:hypothetical protein
MVVHLRAAADRRRDRRYAIGKPNEQTAPGRMIRGSCTSLSSTLRVRQARRLTSSHAVNGVESRTAGTRRGAGEVPGLGDRPSNGRVPSIGVGLSRGPVKGTPIAKRVIGTRFHWVPLTQGVIRRGGGRDWSASADAVTDRIGRIEEVHMGKSWVPAGRRGIERQNDRSARQRTRFLLAVNGQVSALYRSL